MNWLEYFDEPTVPEQLRRICETKLTLKIGAEAKLAVVEVEHMIETVLNGLGTELEAAHEWGPGDPSYCPVAGYDISDIGKRYRIGKALRFAIRPDDMYDAPEFDRQQWKRDVDQFKKEQTSAK